MLFKPGDILYYVNPFVYVIDKVLIEFIDDTSEPFEGYEKINYYVDHSGAYLAEHDLFERLEDAKNSCYMRLNQFYAEKLREINMSNPELDITPDD